MRVLVALDDGAEGEKGLAALAGTVGANDAEMILFSVVDPTRVKGTAGNPGFFHSLTPEGDISGGLLRDHEPTVPPAEDHGQALARAREERAQHLHQLARRYLPGLAPKIEVAVAEDVPGAIVKAARDAKVQLIALPTHGRTGLPHLLLGSVAEAVVRLAHVPVVLVGPRVETSG